jgi:hypothetical protein
MTRLQKMRLRRSCQAHLAAKAGLGAELAVQLEAVARGEDDALEHLQGAERAEQAPELGQPPSCAAPRTGCSPSVSTRQRRRAQGQVAACHLGELAHVEEVVELGGRGQHLGLDLVPQRDGHGHQLGGGGHHLQPRAAWGHARLSHALLLGNALPAPQQTASIVLRDPPAQRRTSALKTSALKRPSTRRPKMPLMAATLGSGTLKSANWRLRRLGMSFLPPPGTFMAAT